MHIVSKLIPTLFALFVVALMPAFAHAATITFRPITIPRITRTTPAPTPAPAPTPTPTPTPAPTPTPTPAPAPTPTPTSAPAPAPIDFAAQVEQFVVQGMNAERSKSGLAPLAVDGKLAAIARAHSADMLAKNYFSHTSLAGCTVSCRLSAAGYGWRSYGENIHWMSGYNLTAAATANKIVTAWMNSSGHRANILGSQFTVIGVGVAVQGSKIYTTADFALPR